ncbi:unnamed protein product [Closterium sp. NIES-54]
MCLCPAHRPLQPAPRPYSPQAALAAPRTAHGGPLAAPAALLAAPCGPLTAPPARLPPLAAACAVPCAAWLLPALRAVPLASLRVLAFDHEGRPIQFDTWVNNLQLYLLSDSRDGVSLFDHTSGAAPAPPATADSATRSQWLTPHALYDAVVARYSSPATAALGHLLLPYLFPELSTFATEEDLVLLVAIRTRPSLRGAPPPPLPPPMPLLLLLTSLVLRTSGLLLLVGSAAAARARVAGVVAVAAGVVVGAKVEVVEAAEVEVVLGVVAGVGALMAAVVAAVGVAVVAAVGVVVVGLEILSVEVLAVARGSSRSVGVKPGHPSSFVSGFLSTGRLGRPRWAKLLRSRVNIFDMDYDANLATMYALSVSAEGDCYLCVPPDPGIEAAALGASESALPGTALAEALHTFKFDSGASRCFFRDSTTLTLLYAPLPV